MAIKQIFVPVSGERNVDHVFAAAFNLATLFHAHVTAAAALLGLDAYADAGIDVAAQRYADLTNTIRAAQTRKRASAAMAFHKALADLQADNPAAARQISSEWISSEEPVGAMVSRFGRLADLIVVDIPGTDVGTIEHKILHTAVYSVRRPVVVVPPGANAIARRGAIAWNGSLQIATAVREAIGLLSTMDHVEIIQAGALPHQATSLSTLESYLNRWGVPHRLEVIDGGKNKGSHILNAANAAQASVLIMGASRPSHLGDEATGDVTRYMLGHSNMALFIAR